MVCRMHLLFYGAYTLHDCISYIMHIMIEYSIDIVSGVIMILYPAI